MGRYERHFNVGDIKNMDNYNALATKIVNEEDVPAIIKEQFTSLERLKEQVQVSSEKAQKAQESAKKAKNQSAGLFQKKEAIEKLQDATSDLADAQISSAEAQKVSFEYQQKLGEITKYLFGLGVTNIAMNRTVVRNLKMQLEGASSEELDEMARNEIIAVIKQLKAQQDIMIQQQDISAVAKQNKEDIEFQARETEQLKDRTEQLEKQQDILVKNVSENTAKGSERDQRISLSERKNAELEEETKRQAKKDEEHDLLLKRAAEERGALEAETRRQAQKDAELEEETKRQAQKDEEHDARLVEVEKKNIEQDRLIQELTEKINSLEAEKTNKKTTLFSFIVGAAGLIAAIVQFFI